MLSKPRNKVLCWKAVDIAMLDSSLRPPEVPRSSRGMTGGGDDGYWDGMTSGGDDINCSPTRQVIY